MEEGLLTGRVRLSHNTGGRNNWQVAFLFAEWDDMDDFAALFADAEAYERVARNIYATTTCCGVPCRLQQKN